MSTDVVRWKEGNNVSLQLKWIKIRFVVGVVHDDELCIYCYK